MTYLPKTYEIRFKVYSRLDKIDLHDFINDLCKYAKNREAFERVPMTVINLEELEKNG